MKEQKINVKLTLTDGYEKRYTEAVCKVLAQRNKQLIPPDSVSVFEASDVHHTKKWQQDKAAI